MWVDKCIEPKSLPYISTDPKYALQVKTFYLLYVNSYAILSSILVSCGFRFKSNTINCTKVLPHFATPIFPFYDINCIVVHKKTLQYYPNSYIYWHFSYIPNILWRVLNILPTLVLVNLKYAVFFMFLITETFLSFIILNYFIKTMNKNFFGHFFFFYHEQSIKKPLKTWNNYRSKSRLRHYQMFLKNKLKVHFSC